MADVTEHLGSRFLKVADLVAGPRRLTIGDVALGDFGKFNLFFQDGSVLSLSKTNLRTLAAAWGTQSAAWLGRPIELYVGAIQYQGAQQPAVLVRTIGSAPRGPGDTFDSDVPF